MISPSPSSVPPHDPGPGGRPSWLLIGPALAASLGAFLLAGPVGLEGESVRRELHLPSSATLWVFVAFLLPAALTALLGVLLGRRWPTAVTLPATALLILGTLLTALAP
ncbi:hypothetical protein ACFQ0D_37300, partial [Micromonospora zhanjiangensis]